MTTRFYSRLVGTLAYKRFAKGRPLSTREQALLHLACAHAEFELGTLRTEVAVQNEQIEGHIFKAKVAYVLGQGGAVMRGAVTFLTTPFSDYSYAFALPPPPGSQATTVGTRRNEEPRTEPEVPSGSPSQSEGRLMAALPEWAKGPIRLAADYLGRLSPLTTAILFFLVIAGSITYANHKYGEIENSYKLVVAENERLKGLEAAYTEASETLQSNAGVVEGLRERIRSLEGSVEEKKKDIGTLKIEHQAALDSARANLDAATKEALRLQNERIAALENEKASLQSSLNDERDRNNSATLGERISANRDLERKRREFDALIAFTLDTLINIRANLLENDPTYTTRSRAEFRRVYKLAYSSNRELFERLGITQF